MPKPGPTVLICGSRYWTDFWYLDGYVHTLVPSNAVIIHGDARGADKLAGVSAQRHGLTVQAFPADWNTHGNAAGPIRNQQMLEQGNPSWVVAFTYDLFASCGTRDMVVRALKSRRKVYLNPLSQGNLKQQVFLDEHEHLHIGRADNFAA